MSEGNPFYGNELPAHPAYTRLTPVTVIRHPVRPVAEHEEVNARQPASSPLKGKSGRKEGEDEDRLIEARLGAME